jgi:hypothetical protein
MAFDFARGDTRPLLIGFSVITLLGWGLFIYAELDKAENQRGARREILALSANQESVRTQLAQQADHLPTCRPKSLQPRCK